MKHLPIKTEIKKWGNSIGLVIPKTLSHNLQLEAGTEVELEAEGNRLVVKVLPPPTITLDSILQSWPEDYRTEETDWGTPRGNELW